MFPFYTPWKAQESLGFLMLSGSINRNIGKKLVKITLLVFWGIKLFPFFDVVFLQSSHQISRVFQVLCMWYVLPFFFWEFAIFFSFFFCQNNVKSVWRKKQTYTFALGCSFQIKPSRQNHNLVDLELPDDVRL